MYERFSNAMIYRHFQFSNLEKHNTVNKSRMEFFLSCALIIIVFVLFHHRGRKRLKNSHCFSTAGIVDFVK